jgi:C4-dicarboxylate-specific signal transduction histidine kinase
MASVLAHEIMNSLTAISSLSESLSLMLQEGAGAEVAGALESIQRRSLGLLDFVERYRMIMDMPAPRMQPLRVEELLAGIEHLLGPSFKERGVLFTRSVEPPQLTCRADPRLLEQALINLLKNSVEALGGTAQPRIDVAVRQREGLLVMTVADNGRGLPELGEAESAGSESARLVSAKVDFARPESARAATAGVESARPELADTATAGRNSVPVFTTKAAGSGIGLHLVRKIALSHGGQLEAQRNQPRGSIFTLTLPLTA